MLDIKFIRENKDLVAAGAKKKHVEIDLDALVALDDKRKSILGSVEAKRAEKTRPTTPLPTQNCRQKGKN